MNKLKEKLKDLEKLDIGLNKLKNFNWQTINEIDPLKKQVEIERIISEFIDFLPFIVQILDTYNEGKFYRVRLFKSSIDNSLIQEFGPPPVSECRNYQRANIPMHPVFYCSKDPNTAIVEQFWNRNIFEKCFYLTEWEFYNDRSKINVPFIYQELLIEDYTRFDLGIKTDKVIAQIFKNFSKEECNFIKQYILALSAFFLTVDQDYTLSSFLGHKYLYAPHNLRADFITYPSIQKKGHGLNFAFHPNAYFDLLKMNKIYECNLNAFDYENNLIQLSVVAVGVNIKSIIHWKNEIDENEKLYLNQIFGNHLNGALK
jgi:hypothetical protein